MTGENGLVKGLGLIDSTTLVMGSMIGSGVFIVAADIISFAIATLMKNDVDSLGVINNPEPVTNILTLSVHRKRLIVHDIVDKKRNQLFGKLE